MRGARHQHEQAVRAIVVSAVVILIAGVVYATATNYIVPTLVVPFEAAATAARSAPVRAMCSTTPPPMQ